MAAEAWGASLSTDVDKERAAAAALRAELAGAQAVLEAKEKEVGGQGGCFNFCAL